MSKFILNGKVKLYTETFGNVDDTPVLLIAGAMAPCVFWDSNFCLALADKGYYVIRYDNRDIGNSTHFPQSQPETGIKPPYSIDDMVEDAKMVLTSHTDKSAHIVGHSLGGSIAQLFAITNPNKTRTTTVISGPILAKGDIKYSETDPAITKKLWDVLMSNPMHQNYIKGAPEFLRIWNHLNGDWDLNEKMANRYTKAIYNTEIIAPAWNHTNVQSKIRDIMADLQKLQKPILFVHGQKDYLPADPANVKLLAEYLPNAECFIIKGAGHMFFNEKLWKILEDQISDHITSRGILYDTDY